MIWFYSLLLLLGPSLVLGLPSRTGAISNEEYDELRYYAHFAQAPYCPDNDEPVTNFTRPRFLRCPGDVCGSLDGRIKIYYGLSVAPPSERATGFIAVDQRQKRLVVSFRGAMLWKEVSTAAISYGRQTTLAYFSECPKSVLESCKTALSVDSQWTPVREKVFRTIRRLLRRKMYSNYRVVFVGHSFGGAVATLAATDYRAHYPYSPKPRAFLYTFGAPRIFNRPMANFAQGLSQDNYRVTHYLDIGVRVPPATLGYEHIGPEYYIIGDRLEDETPQNITRLLAPHSNFLAPLENQAGAYNHGTAGLPREPEWHGNYLIPISSQQCIPSRAQRPMYADLPNGPQLPPTRDIDYQQGPRNNYNEDSRRNNPNSGYSSNTKKGNGNRKGNQNGSTKTSGARNGNTNGYPNGNANRKPNGNRNGNPNGDPNGSPNGGPNGSPNGDPNGNANVYGNENLNGNTNGNTGGWN